MGTYIGIAPAGTEGEINAINVVNTPAGDIASTNVQGALNELDVEKATTAYVDSSSGVVQANLNAHINDLTDAHLASAITNLAAGNITSDNVQGAINELDLTSSDNASNLIDHLLDLAAHTALAITYDNGFSGLTSVNIQAAIDELAGGAGGGALQPWQLVDTGVTIANGNRIMADSSAGSFPITLPLAPAFGEEVEIKDADNTFASFGVTVGRNGEIISGIDEDLILDLNGAYIRFVFRGGAIGWSILSTDT